MPDPFSDWFIVAMIALGLIVFTAALVLGVTA